MSDERAVMPRVEIYPQGESVEDSIRAGVQEMTDSQVSATAAALGYLGYELNSKLIISQVNKQTNAYKVLKIGDEVISLDNIKYKSQSEIARSLDDKNPGQIVSVKVLRSGSQIIEEQIKLSAREDGSAYIGIGITNKYDFPFEVKIQLKETGGPSGGLIFALGIIDKLTEQDLIRSRNIAGTGTISTSGQVGPIGGIAEKIIGAEKAGVQVFFTPVQNCAELVEVDQILKNKGPKGMKIVPVATLSEAVSILNMPNNAQYPSCKSIA
jgi:PDZ domain-containing protein